MLITVQLDGIMSCFDSAGVNGYWRFASGAGGRFQKTIEAEIFRGRLMIYGGSLTSTKNWIRR